MIDYNKLEEQAQEIEKQLIDLENRLADIKQLLHSSVLWADEAPFTREGDIGFFQIHKAKLILGALYQGRVLRFIHQSCGRTLVWMNPQSNRIFVRNEGKNLYFTEDNIMNFIVWRSGAWYIVTNPPNLDR